MDIPAGKVLNPPMTETATDALTLQLLEWVAARPRGYGETLEAWRTSCPRLPVWEDAVSDGLVEAVAGDGGLCGRQVRLTEAGRRRLLSP